jgi:hypothetical protein
MRMVRRSVAVGWWSFAAFMAVALPSAAQSSASFPDEKLAPAPTQPAPTQPAPAPAAPPPASTDALRGPPPPPPLPYTGNDVRIPVSIQRAPAAPSSDLPPLLPYREGLPVPDGYVVVERPATGLITGGLIGFGVAYATGIIVGATQGFKNGTGLVFIPIVGPYAAVATREYDCSVSSVEAAKRCTVTEVQIVTLLAVDGLGQTAGALVALAGLIANNKELVRTDLKDVSFTPAVNGPNDWRLQVSGAF